MRNEVCSGRWSFESDGLVHASGSCGAVNDVSYIVLGSLKLFSAGRVRFYHRGSCL